ncbi:hypothetical protein C4544_01130 [candidate division WS5 bacterium]|uniref:Uncharacterized protein n=1 Tax=candidate division WS5 bacterium TaxID=2093353 RepID=A0A419DG78_9BACT|nr:MAG: hypothetical protein C4544_01130 [candidate division WS5 bacterium]
MATNNTEISPEDLVVNQVGLDGKFLPEFTDYTKRLLQIVCDESLTFSQRRIKIRGLAPGYINGLSPKDQEEMMDGLGKIHDKVMELKE